MPSMRAYADARPRGRRGVFVLSGLHGLLDADTVIRPYDRPLDLAQARRLRPFAGAALAEALERLVAAELVVLAEPLYLLLIADVLALPARPAVHWFPDPAADFDAAIEVFERWGWR